MEKRAQACHPVPDPLSSHEDEGEPIAEIKAISLPGRYGLFCRTLRTLTFSPDGTHLAWCMGGGIVKVLPWPLPSNIHAVEIQMLDNGPMGVCCMAFGTRASNRGKSDKNNVKDQKLLLATGLWRGQINVWDVSTGTLLSSLYNHRSHVTDLVFTKDGSLTFVSASMDSTLRVWQWGKKGIQSQALSCSQSWVYKCCISPDSSLIASICNIDTKVYLWSLRTLTIVRNLNYNRKREMVSCDFSPDGALLAVGSNSMETGWWLNLWDPYTAEQLMKMEACDLGWKRMNAFTFSPAFPQMAIGSNRSLQVWDMDQDKTSNLVVKDYTVDGVCCTFNPHGSVIALGFLRGRVLFWKAPQVVPSLRHLCRTVLRYSVSTFQLRALPLPKEILDFLTYRNLPQKKTLCCSKHSS